MRQSSIKSDGAVLQPLALKCISIFHQVLLAGIRDRSGSLSPTLISSECTYLVMEPWSSLHDLGLADSLSFCLSSSETVKATCTSAEPGG